MFDFFNSFDFDGVRFWNDVGLQGFVAVRLHGYAANLELTTFWGQLSYILGRLKWLHFVTGWNEGVVYLCFIGRGRW